MIITIQDKIDKVREAKYPQVYETYILFDKRGQIIGACALGQIDLWLSEIKAHYKGWIYNTTTSYVNSRLSELCLRLNDHFLLPLPEIAKTLERELTEKERATVIYDDSNFRRI